jgi:hypothetical protein
MPRYRERRWPWIVAGYTAFAAILAPVTAFLCDIAAPAYRPEVIRLAVALVVAVVLIHVKRHFRGDPLWDPPSDFANALAREPPAPKIDPGFLKLREEIAHSTASRSYFETVLWPHLRDLATRRAGGKVDSVLPFPPAPRWPHRGPSRRELAALVGRLEDRT